MVCSQLIPYTNSWGDELVWMLTGWGWVGYSCWRAGDADELVMFVSQSDVIPIGISDHFMTYCTRKVSRSIFNKHKTSIIRSLKKHTKEKIIEQLRNKRIVYNQLEHYLKENNLLYKLQSGFRTSFSTGTCLTFLMDYIRSEMDFGNYIGMVMIDLQKAFDTGDHSILENKLKAIGLDGNAIAWFDAYLTNRMQVTDVGGIISDPRVVPCGVPHGSILRPLLFLIYVNDMEASVSCKIILYADDSVSIRKTHKNYWKRFRGQFVVSQQLTDRQQVVPPPR